MSEQFDRRLAAARDRAVAEKQRAEKQAAAERQTLDQLAGLQRAALRQWQKRIFPLIKQVVEAANKELRDPARASSSPRITFA
jgi:phage gp29-like protein